MSEHLVTVKRKNSPLTGRMPLQNHCSSVRDRHLLLLQCDVAVITRGCFSTCHVVHNISIFQLFMEWKSIKTWFSQHLIVTKWVTTLFLPYSTSLSHISCCWDQSQWKEWLSDLSGALTRIHRANCLQCQGNFHHLFSFCSTLLADWGRGEHQAWGSRRGE